MRLDFRHLRLLVAIDDAGSLTRAARLLGTDLAQLSRGLRRIEEQLGHPVFLRGPGGARPTPAGQEVLARARRALDLAGGLLAAPAAVAELRLLHAHVDPAPLLAGLRSAHPGLAVELGHATRAAAADALAAGAADAFVGLRLPHQPAADLGELVEFEHDEQPAAVATVRSPLDAALPIDLHDLAGDDLVLPAPPDLAAAVVAECRSVGRFEPRRCHRVADTAHAAALVRAGAGFTLVFPSSWPDRAPDPLPYRGAMRARRVLVVRPDGVPPDVVATLNALAGGPRCSGGPPRG